MSLFVGIMVSIFWQQWIILLRLFEGSFVWRDVFLSLGMCLDHRDHTWNWRAADSSPGQFAVTRCVRLPVSSVFGLAIASLKTNHRPLVGEMASSCLIGVCGFQAQASLSTYCLMSLGKSPFRPFTQPHYFYVTEHSFQFFIRNMF